MPVVTGDAPKTRLMLAAGRRFAGENGIGIAVSLGLHLLLVLLVLAMMTRSSREAIQAVRMPFVIPIDLIQLGDETRAPPADTKGPIPQQKAGRPHDSAALQPRAISPSGRKPAPLDAIDTKLKALAKLKQPDSQLKLASGAGVSNVDVSSGAAGASATYSIRDYVLAQVLRRWTLNLDRARNRNLVVQIAVTMKRDGSIVSAEIIELNRYKSDALYRDIAIGARNAVLLSSPIVLPPGDYPKEMHFTLSMDTRAVLR